MLFAILYADDGDVVGAALACDQYQFGRRYWQEIHSEPLLLQPEWETSYIEIGDERLADRLLEMDFRDGREAAAAIDRYLGPGADHCFDSRAEFAA